jgi:hypothetical protein
MSAEEDLRREGGCRPAVARIASEIAHAFEVPVHEMLRTGKTGKAATARARLCERLAGRGWPLDAIERHFGMPNGWAKAGVALAKRIPVLVAAPAGPELVVGDAYEEPPPYEPPKRPRSPVSGEWKRVDPPAPRPRIVRPLKSSPPGFHPATCVQPAIRRGKAFKFCGTAAFQKDVFGRPICTYHAAQASRARQTGGST